MLWDSPLVILEDLFRSQLYGMIFNVDPLSPIGKVLNNEFANGFGHAHSYLLR